MTGSERIEPSATVYVLMINDRHVDTVVRVFTSAEPALAAARELAAENGWLTHGPDDPADDYFLDGLPDMRLLWVVNPRESDEAFVDAVQVES